MAKRYPDAIKHFPLSTQIFIKKIHNRIESGRNALICVVGQTGSGKSFSTLNLMIGLDLYRYGEMKPMQFYLDHCIFRAKDLMEGLNEPDLKRKTTWIWDEAGVDAGSGEHASIKNRVIGWLAQTFRNLQQVVFFTLPTLGMLTHQVRKLLHYYVEAVLVDKKKKVCVMKPLEMQYNTRMDKIYYHNLSYPGGDGFVQSVDMMGVPLAPKELLDAYESKKEEFTRDLNLKIQDTLQEIENKENGGGTIKHRHIKLYIAYHNITKVQKDIAPLIGINPQSVSSQMKTMDKWYPGWRDNPNMLGNLEYLTKLNDLEVPQLKLETLPSDSDKKG